MTQETHNSVTGILHRINADSSDEAAREELLRVIYDQLHKLARGRMNREPKDHTLQATALVNEAFLKIFRGDDHAFRNRDHFLALASTAMRSILVDHARTKNCVKRSPGGERVPLTHLDHLVNEYKNRSHDDLLGLDEALKKLAKIDATLVQIAELRFFGGFSMEEAARVVGLSLRKTEREWQTARAWLRKEME